MITADIIDQGAIDTTLPPTSDPLYQLAALSLFYRQQWAALRTAGFNFARPEVSDFSTFNNELSTYLDNAHDRETEIIQTGASAISANLPDILSIGAAFASGGASAAAACVVNTALGKLLGGDSGAIGDYEVSQASPDMTEVVDKLEELRQAVNQVLSTFNINLLSDQYEAYFSATQDLEEEQ